ncbi:hypothetical protein GGI05_002091, partial [Coemansia sp. RSA 2603]
MDIGIEQHIFDELPAAYQMRIRDIEQELKDGEITQKGFGKRLERIMQEYHASTAFDSSKSSGETHFQVTSADRQPTFESQTTSGSSTNTSSTNLMYTPRGGDSPAEPVVVSRNQAAAPIRPNYDARKSTAMGFRKPGINFEALLDDFGSGQNDEDENGNTSATGYQSQGSIKPVASPPIPSLKYTSGADRSRESMQFGFSLGSPLQSVPPVPTLPQNNVEAYGAGRDGPGGEYDELTSGRAYNVLNDIMDPYGTQSSRNERELYSDDDESNNSMLDEMADLEPTGYNPDIVSAQSTLSRANGNAMANGQSAGSLSETTRTNSLVNTQGMKPAPMRVAAARDMAEMLASTHLLSPDTPTVGLFIHNNIPPDATVTAAALAAKKPMPPPVPLNSIVTSGPIMSPVSGVQESGFEDELNGTQRRVSSSSVATDNAATSTSGVGTITLEDMAHASGPGNIVPSDGASGVQGEMSVGARRGSERSVQHKRTSIQSAAFGSLDVVKADRTFPALPEQPGDEHGMGRRQMAAPMPPVPALPSRQQMDNSPQVSRRPTYNGRGGSRRPTNGGMASGRMSYYPAEAEAELEAPANFDMLSLADHINSQAGDEHVAGEYTEMAGGNQSMHFTFEESAAMSMDAQAYLEMSGPEQQRGVIDRGDGSHGDAAGEGALGRQRQSSYIYENPLTYEDWDASMQVRDSHGAEYEVLAQQQQQQQI